MMLRVDSSHWISVLALYLVSTSEAIETSRNNTMSRLATSLLNGYDARFRPVRNPLLPIDVSAEFELTRITDLDVSNQKMSVMLFITMSWMDELLRWSPSDYDNITSIRLPHGTIWTPRLTSYDATENLGSPDRRVMDTILKSDGTASMAMVEKTSVTCTFNLTSFPADIQTCSFMYAPENGKLFSEILFSTMIVKKAVFYQSNSEYALLGVKRLDGAFGLSLEVKVKRNSSYLLKTLIYPLFFLAILSCASFMLPPDSEAKLDIQVNVMLSYALYSMILSDTLSPTDDNSQPIILDIVSRFLAVNTLLIVATCFILRLTHIKEFKPHDKLFKAVIVIGQLLLVPYKGCVTKCSNSKVMSTQPNDNDHIINVKEKTTPVESQLLTLFEWIENHKSDQQEDCSEQRWLYVAAVLDRMLLIGVFVTLVVNYSELIGLSSG